MKSKILIIFFFAVPLVIYGGKVPEFYPEEVEKINVLAKDGTEINNVLVLKEDGLLGEGGYGFVYEGIMKEDNRVVAIKFVKSENFTSCQREINMYCYLKAYKNADVEKYGIPVVYYYGRWENYILTAFTKFDKELLDVANENSSLGRNPLDILILLRDFVFQSKYLHSCGVRHDDIKPENIMLRGSRSFLIDFNSSSKMKEDKRGGSEEYVCKRYNTRETRRAIDDYESFLFTISVIMRKNWFGSKVDNKSRKKLLGKDGLEKIIKAFADEVFTDNASKRFPDYNKLEKMISLEIKKLHPNGAPTFSWLAPDSETSPERKITDIPEPKSIDFENFEYPPTVRLTLDGSAQQPILASHSSIKKKKSSKKVFGCFSKKPFE